MSDAAFKSCYHLRHMFPVLGTSQFCICGAVTNFSRTSACPQITVRNQTRNTAHSDVSRGLRSALQPRSVVSGYFIVQAWRIMIPVYTRLILKTLINPNQRGTTLVLSPLSMSHLQPTTGSMVDLIFLWGLLPFFVHGRSTISIASAVMMFCWRETSVSPCACYSNTSP